MQKHRFLRFAVLALAVLTVLSCTAFAEETDTAEDTTLTFGVFSDIHDASSYMTNVMNNFETLAGGNENIDGIAMVGDITYLDTNETPVAATYNIIKNNADLVYFMEADKLAFAMGNHEFPLNANSDPMASLSRQVFTEQVGYAPESHHVFEGYHFITGGPNTYDGKMTAEQEQYVMDEVTKALADGDEKPVFVLIHHPIDGTLHGSGTTRHSDEFVEFLKAEPRIIVFDGHMHYPETDPRSIYQVKGGATFIYTSAVNGGNTLSHPWATQRHDKAFPSQAYLMQVDTETNVVTLKRFYVGATPEYLEEGDWVLDIPAMIAESEKAEDEIDLSVYKFTYEKRAADSVAPVYDADAEITVTSLNTKNVSITYPVAQQGAAGEDNIVGYYKVDVCNKATGEVFTKKFISDYFLKPASRRTSFSCSFSGLEYETEYTVSVTPLNMWFVEGEPITIDITTPGLPAGFGTITGYSDSYYAAPVTLNESGNGWNIDTAAAFKLTAENNIRLAGIYAVSKDSFVTKDIVYVYGSRESREAIYPKVNSKFVLNGSGNEGKFAPGKFSANTWIGVPGTKDFYSDTQWYNKYIVEYFSVEADPEGTEGGKTLEEKRLEVAARMIADVKSQNTYVGYALTNTEITPISEVSTLSFGFGLNAVYARVSMTIKNSTFRLVAYVMDKEGNVTTHGTVGGAVTLKTGASSYSTFNFKTAEWDTPLPEEGYFVGYRIYPYYGLNDPADVVLTTSKATAAEIGTAERVRFIAYPSTYTVDIPKAPTPTGIEVDGTTFNGLDKNTTYSVAPYSINGADNANAVEVKGVTSYTLPEGAVGPYGIYIKGDGIDLADSDATIIYVRGSYTARLDLHDRLDSSAGTNYVGTYKVVSTATPGAFSYTLSTWTGHKTFGSGNGISTTGDHISSGQSKTLYTAYTAEDATDETKQAAFDKMISSTNITSIYLQYNMASDEIIPISEINKYSYKVSKQRGGFTYKNQVSEFSVLIMDSNSTVTEYTYQHVAKNLSATEVTKTVDFKNKTSSYGTWIDELPAEGYVVGFRYKIYANLDNFANVVVSSATTGTRYMIVPTTSYTIDTPKADAHTGTTVEGTSFKGLDVNKTFAIAPYSAVGIDTALEKTVTGVTEFDVAANFENAKGIYVIYVKGDGENYTDSEPFAVCYIQGTIADKQNIVFDADGNYNLYPVRFDSMDRWYAGYFAAPTSSSWEAFVPCTRASNILSTWFFPASTDTATNKANLPKVRYAYAYNPDEIPTVKELNSISFKIGGQNSSLVAGAKAKVNFVVLHPDGKVTEHSALTEQYTFKVNNYKDFTVSFKNIPGIPEEGYVLGFEIFPFGELVTMSPEATSFANLGIYFYFTSNSVSIAKGEAPEGITVDGTTFKGLDAAKTYIVAPYTVAGATEEDVKTVTGVTSVDIATLYDSLVGLYGIAYDANDYNSASDPGAVIYAPKSSAARKALGNPKELTYTWNNGANTVNYTASEFEKVKESVKEWSVGKLLGAEYFIYNGTDYNSYKCDWMYSTPSSKALYEAEQAADGSLAELQKEAKGTVESISFRYAYAPEEIIPIDDVIEMKFAAALGTTYINVSSGRSKYVLYVMNTDGTVTQHVYLSPERTLTTDISGSTKNTEIIEPRKHFADLPEEGWIIGYKFYPYGEINHENITYIEANKASTSTQYAFYVRTPLVDFEDTYVIVEDSIQLGMSLLLDGKIGIKVTSLAEDMTDMTLANVVGTDNYVDFGTNGYAVFYFDPKDAADAKVSFDVISGDETVSLTLTVADYIEELKGSDDAEVVDLITACETYFEAASRQFYGTDSEVEALPDFTADELADLDSKTARAREGEIAGLEFVSTSLVLEEDTTIRHYFKITDDSIKTEEDLALYTVDGGAALKLSMKKNDTGIRYAYVDVADISADELATVMTVTVTDKDGSSVTVDFSALAYVDLCLDKEDVTLLNLAKALYRYSVATDAYVAE